jgi:hypothetical protein
MMLNNRALIASNGTGHINIPLDAGGSLGAGRARLSGCYQGVSDVNTFSHLYNGCHNLIITLSNDLSSDKATTKNRGPQAGSKYSFRRAYQLGLLSPLRHGAWLQRLRVVSGEEYRISLAAFFVWSGCRPP